MITVSKFITVLPSGYGHNKIIVDTMENGRFSTITDNTRLTDKYKDEDTRDQARIELIELVMANNYIDNYEIF